MKEKKEKPKPVRFELIPETESPYKYMRKMRKKYHKEIKRAKIALAWRIALKPDRDGHLILGKCCKASDLQRELAVYDFVILLNKEVWNDPKFGKKKKYALIDHELCHVGVILNKHSKQKKDERGRYLFRVRKHDIEEFRSVVKHHGVWKRDLELFAEALLKKKRRQ
jgi:hypothetical protein